MIGLHVSFEGWAYLLSIHHQRNLFKGTAPFGRAARQAYGEALAYWHQMILPRHFKKSAHQRYDYQDRKPPYLRIKRRLAQRLPVRGRDGEQIRGRDARVIRGGEISIVRSGTTERKALARVLIRTYPKYGIATIQVPSYITMRSRQGKPNQKEELKQLTDQDIKRCSARAATAFFRTLKAEGRKARKTKLRLP